MSWCEGTHGSPSYYSLPNYYDFDDADIDFLLLKRKEENSFRDEMLAFQKEASLLIKNIETKETGIKLARFFSDQASDSLKRYRGICHVLYFVMADPPGDCNRNVSKEISPYADRAYSMVAYR